MEFAGIKVWDGNNELGVSNVAIEDGRFKNVAPSATEQWEGFSLVPGLIDTHTHLVCDSIVSEHGPDADESLWALTTPEAEQVLHAAANAISFMQQGVTSVFDKAADERSIILGRAFDKGVLIGPRVFTNCAVGMTGGHGDLFTHPMSPRRRAVADGPDECRKMVRYWARAGATAIKTYTSGGLSSIGAKVGWRNYTQSEISAIVDEAHALGLQVAAHAHTEAGIQAALDSGVDGIEHATALTARQAEQAAAQGISIGPTLVTLDSTVDGGLSDSPHHIEAQKLFAGRNDRLRAAKEAGVVFRLATDTGGGSYAIGVVDELQAMIKVLGLTDEEALRTATSVAASSMGIANDIGSVREGHYADFIICKGEPWSDVNQLRPNNIVAVYCRGKLVHGDVVQQRAT